MKDKDFQILEEAYGKIKKEKYFTDLLKDITVFAKNKHSDEVSEEKLCKNLISIAEFLKGN